MVKSKLNRLLEELSKHKMGMGLIFSFAHGEMLDRYGEMVGMKRKRWWIFKESDNNFKARILYKSMVEEGIIEDDEPSYFL